MLGKRLYLQATSKAFSETHIEHYVYSNHFSRYWFPVYWSIASAKMTIMGSWICLAILPISFQHSGYAQYYRIWTNVGEFAHPCSLAWNKQNKYWYSVGFSLDTVTGNLILPPSPCTSDMKTYLTHMAPWLQNQEWEPKKTVWQCSPTESELRFIYFLLLVHGLCSEKVKTVNSKLAPSHSRCVLQNVNKAWNLVYWYSFACWTILEGALIWQMLRLPQIAATLDTYCCKLL